MVWGSGRPGWAGSEGAVLQPPGIVVAMRQRTNGTSTARTLDTNRCSWSDVGHDEHTFEVLDAGSGPVTLVTVSAGGAGVQRRRRHSTYRKTETGASGFRPGTPAERSALGSAGHRTRPTLGGCGEPRTAARAAAIRRRHVLLAVLALGLLVALAAPWASGAKSGFSATSPAPAVPTLSAHSLYIVQPGDTLWSIAQRLDPQSDPRPVVALLSAQVGSDTVSPGEHLRLP
jgi:hypothetical protein